MSEEHARTPPRLHVVERREPAPGRGNTLLVAGACLVSAAAGGVFAVGIVAGGSVAVQGTALAVATFALAFAVRRAFAADYPQVVAAEERHEPPAQPGPLAAVQPLRRRALLVRVVAGAAGLFGLSLLAPVSSLGTPRRGVPEETAWTDGRRLVDQDGEPLRADDVVDVALAWPEGRPPAELDSVIVVRLGDRPAQPTNLDGVVDGTVVAYSLICTHAGCPVGLYQAATTQLFCPCHQATFDAARGATPTFGPAARALPQLPLGVNDAGELVALGDFDGPVGPHVGRA